MAKIVRKQREINFKPNYLFYWMLYRYEIAKDRLNPLMANEQYPKGQKVTPVFVNLGGTRCFYNGQLVVTDNGSKPIKDLNEGDLVLSYNHELAKKEYKSVVGVIKNENNTKECYEICFKNKSIIKCTTDHEFYSNGKYSPIKTILKKWFDDGLTSDFVDGLDLSTIDTVKTVKLSTTYDLTVQDNANYYLDCDCPVLVHNSSKTYDEIHLIYNYFTNPENKHLRCIVYRDTLVLCRKYTLNDFKTCFNLMGLIPDVDYTLTGEISGSPQITIRGNVIDFMGYPEPGKQAGQCHIALINEVLDSDRQEAIENILQRCTMFAMIDANPNKTVHFIYNKEGQFNWFFSKTTYIDNMHLPEGLQGGYESKCPWDFRDSKLMIFDYNPNLSAGWQTDDNGNKIFFNGFRRRVWQKEECPENYKDQPYPNNKYRAPHPTNTAPDRFWWLTMGEGEKASREGAVFQYKKISEFPYDSCDSVKFGLDFGYSSDPSVLTIVGINKKELKAYIKYLTYQRTPNPILLFDLVAPHLMAEEKRRKIEAGWVFDENDKVIKKGYEYEHIKIACDSSDKFKDEEFVRSLQTICRQKGLSWDFVKVKKPHIVVRISQMKVFNLLVVESDKKIWNDKHGDPAMYEFTNYVYQIIDERQSNIPTDDFNHGIDSAGYAIWYFFKRITDKHLVENIS